MVLSVISTIINTISNICTAKVKVYECHIGSELRNGLKLEVTQHNKIGGKLIMDVSIYSREAIERLIENNFPANTAVISFYDPPNKCKSWQREIDYKGKAKMLFQVAVHDIDIDVLNEFGFTFETYFTEAEELAEFICKAYNDEFNIICQCEYGQSRSAACAAAILEHFYRNGISVFRDYRYYPNQLIFNKIYEALEKIDKCKKIY